MNMNQNQEVELISLEEMCDLLAIGKNRAYEMLKIKRSRHLSSEMYGRYPERLFPNSSSKRQSYNHADHIENSEATLSASEFSIVAQFKNMKVPQNGTTERKNHPRTLVNTGFVDVSLVTPSQPHYNINVIVFGLIPRL